jgi:glutamate/tyrosine decarboxylase-like PLP-dependent enzyme
MLPAKLDEAIAQKVQEGYTPFFVGATAGTTVLGAFDPFVDVHSVCERHGLWMHVDAAWGGGAMFSGTKKTRDLCEGVHLADSLAYNPHKMMGAPLQCSTFLTKHLGALESANAANAAYLFQPDKNFTDLDTGDKTIQCGRHADSLKLWLMWKSLGDKGLQNRVDHCIWLTEYMASRLEKQLDQNGNRCFVQVAPTQYSNLCFYLVPPSMRSPEFNSIDVATPEQLDALSKVSPIVKDRMQRAGKAMIGFQPVNGFHNCFRMVIAGSKETLCTDGINSILGSMLALSTDL